MEEDISAYLELACFAKKIKMELVKKVLLCMIITITHVVQAFDLARGVSTVFNNGYKIRIAFFLAIVIFAIVARSLLSRYNESHTKK